KLSLPDFSKWGSTETKPLSGIRMETARRTKASWQNIPHVFQFDEADISEIEKYMEKNKEKAEEAGGKLTITAILLKVSASALQQFPKFNASIDPEKEEMILKHYIHIGIAVDTEKGLLLPVIRDVDKKSIIELAAEITKVAEKAREGKLSPDEMKGGNFSISNLGGIGGTNFTPIIYHPQVAILGVSRAKTSPVFSEGEFKPREVLPLSLSYDHRLIDGAEGAEFLHWIVQALEDPYKALLGA
ncbi:MAG: 2-oxo acid dehydrogenase subunit E2, partial [Bacteroidota bacterium]